MGKCPADGTVNGAPQSAFIGAGAPGAENAVTLDGDADKTDGFAAGIGFGVMKAMADHDGGRHCLCIPGGYPSAYLPSRQTKQGRNHWPAG
ncbi:hypothetical protein D7X33_04145 [Butyricicoccus sp. 1XD8-22]|nr:hypothetical protein D7X33_04145 [Butyricicoccus sp. 1XD8-22]